MPLVVPALKVVTTAGVPIERCFYTDRYGKVTDLTTQWGAFYKAGVDGRYMPPVQHMSEGVPQLDGERYRQTRAVPRAITVPVTLVADDVTTLRARLRGLAQGLNPKRGPGTLTVETNDGLKRYVTCAYESGMESGIDGNQNEFFQDVAFTFRAWDPYWYDVAPTTYTWSLEAGHVPFFPIPPVRLGPSTIMANETASNPGDTDSWPIWTIKGPGTSLTVLNETTGDQTVISDTSSAGGGAVVIDTRPGAKRITTGSGVSLFPYMTGSLWPLIPGSNDLTVQMPNSAPGAEVSVSFAPGYLGV
jgi:phage-related protein